jgi:hypothetical protein
MALGREGQAQRIPRMVLDGVSLITATFPLSTRLCGQGGNIFNYTDPGAG